MTFSLNVYVRTKQLNLSLLIKNYNLDWVHTSIVQETYVWNFLRVKGCLCDPEFGKNILCKIDLDRPWVQPWTWEQFLFYDQSGIEFEWNYHQVMWMKLYENSILKT